MDYKNVRRRSREVNRVERQNTGYRIQELDNVKLSGRRDVDNDTGGGYWRIDGRNVRVYIKCSNE